MLVDGLADASVVPTLDEDPVVDGLAEASVDPTVNVDPVVDELAIASVDPVVGSATRNISVSLTFFR